MVSPSKEPQVLLASEVLPPRDAGGRTATRLAVAHQERATDIARRHGGAVHVRVGLGCVTRYPDPTEALLAASSLLRRDPSGSRNRPSSVRIALHLAVLRADGPALADPSVAFTRTLLGHAGPGEIVLSVDLHEHLRGAGLQTTPIPSQEGAGLPAAHRLLSRPSPPPEQGRPILSGWALGGAVALAIAAVVCTLVVTLTSA